MTEILDRRIELASLANFRSLGELPVAGGTVTPGLLFRSATLAGLTPADREALASLGIRRVFDFRTENERISAPDLLPADFTQVALDVLGDHAGDLAASLGHIGAPGQNPDEHPDPVQLKAVSEAVEAALGDGRGVAMLRDSYRHIVRSYSALEAYRGFFLALSEGGDAYTPSLFHCTTGKDRTGWAAAAFLLALGASEEIVMADYLQTNTDILPMIEPMLQHAESVGIDPELLRPVLTVDASFLETALDEMRTHFGSIEGYFTSGLGLGNEHLRALRTRFVKAG